MLKSFVFFLLIFLVGCGDIEQSLVPESAASGFVVKSAVDDNGILVLSIIGGSKVLHTINTEASIYQKFAVGWHNVGDVLVLYSSDTGGKAWSVNRGEKTELDPLTYKKYAIWLYENKYGKNT